MKEDGLLFIVKELVVRVPKINSRVYAVPATRISEENFRNACMRTW